ncbi:phosphotransferase family protein [Kitasatospora sp. NPDC092039]|uniref:phosphotransferase family protein n=1 Tax=Kitasatospora sp. NPDC092039 TaxID=3364086 RepID=UPI0038226621
MSALTIPDDVERLLPAAAGRCELLGVRSHDRAGRPCVWEVVDEGGRRLFAKRHKNALMHERETAAYRLLAPALGEGRTPSLLAADASSLLVVTSALPGTPVVSTALSAAEEQEVYRQAGHLLAVIHAQPTVDAPVGEYLLWDQERERALARARDACLSDEEVAVLAEAARAEPPRTALAYCHGDFGPRNWLVRRDGDGDGDGDGLTLGVIDFERSHVEAPARRDLMRVTLHLTPRRADLRAAFTTEYGRDLTPQERAACRAWAAIDCPAALRWALDHHRDEEVLGYARTVLDLLRDPNPVV